MTTDSKQGAKAPIDESEALRDVLREVLKELSTVRDIWQVMTARALIEKALRR